MQKDILMTSGHMLMIKIHAQVNIISFIDKSDEYFCQSLIP